MPTKLLRAWPITLFTAHDNSSPAPALRRGTTSKLMTLYDKDFDRTSSFTVTLTEGDEPTIIDALDFAGWLYEQAWTEDVTPAKLDDGRLAVFIKPDPLYPRKTVQAWLRDLAGDADEIILRYLDQGGNFIASLLIAISQAQAERKALELTDEQKAAWLAWENID
jgi:hypothetical protein